MEIAYRFNIKEKKAGEYIQHIIDNERILREQAPEGWTYRGTFFTVQGLGEYDCEQRWELDSYAHLGTGWGHDEAWDQLIATGTGYIDGQVRSTVMKLAHEVAVLEDT